MEGCCACLCLTALSSDKEEINIAAGTSSCAVEERKTKDKFISKYLIIDTISLKLNLFSFCGQNNYNSKWDKGLAEADVKIKKSLIIPGWVVHPCNPRTLETEERWQ